MTETPNRAYTRPLAVLWKLAVTILAAIGFVWLVGGPLVHLLGDPFITKIVGRVYSPDRSAVAEIMVRRGATVWTTRVFAGPPGRSRWIVYETHDSDFVPQLRWLNNKTLVVGLPCGRFDHLSNPDDWESLEPRPNRLRVRFKRPENCSSS
jgi:hypothetical protein